MRSHTFSWLLLAASVVAEVAGTMALRYADGFTRLLPSLLVTIAYAAAIWLMSRAVRQLDVGLAYAVWAGSGVALTAVLGALWFSESMTPMQIAGVVMIVTGVVLLNVFSAQ